MKRGQALRMAIVRQRYNPFGGAERFIERAVSGLAEGGAAISIIARSWQVRAEQASAQSGAVRLVRCDPFFLGRMWRDASFARSVCQLIKGEHFDLVQSHERLACCDVFRAGDGVHRQWLDLRARELGPLGRLAIRLNPYHRQLLATERRMFASHRLRAVICNSAMVRADIERHFVIDPGKLHVIYNGIDLQMFHPALRPLHRAEQRASRGISEQAMVYLLVGSGFERKGIFRLLPAFAAAAPRDSHLVVVGADKRIALARRLAQRLGIGERVHFTGGLNEVRPFYAMADCFVLPTLYDPFPNAAIEALACGLPVITTHQSGAAELIRDQLNGQVCDALDASCLARALAQAPHWRTEVHRSAAREAVAGLSIAAMSARLLALYSALLDKPAQPPQ